MSVGRAATWVAAIMISLAALCAGCRKESEKPAPPPPSTAPVAPATRPTTALPPGASCVTSTCHAGYARASYVHGPVAENSCDSCHGSDVGGHVYPLKRQGVETCTFCHNVIGQRSQQHAVITKEGCTVCHDPHASRTKFLVKADSIQLLCQKCHEVPLKRFAHEPFAAGQCSLCHDPHESDAPKLLRGGSGPDHCMMCHSELKQSMAKASHLHKPATQDCLKCHNAHASEHPQQLVADTRTLCLGCHDEIEREIASAKYTHSPMKDSQSCANCHDAHMASQQALLKARMDIVCSSCHNKQIVAKDGHVISAVAPEVLGKNLHGPIRSGDCAPCHEAHGSVNPQLLVSAFPQSFYAPFELSNYALCFSCHDKEMVLLPQTTSLTNFRDGGRNLHFVHVNREDKGRSCRTCHEIHGSNLPRHMAQSVPFEGSNWAMPIRYESLPDGGTCSPGCHASFTYRRSATTRPTGGGVK